MLGVEDQHQEMVRVAESLVAVQHANVVPGFLEALTHDKTTVFAGEIPEITETGFIDKTGDQHEVDVIICATG
jgi:hypothetical protein